MTEKAEDRARLDALLGLHDELNAAVTFAEAIRLAVLGIQDRRSSAALHAIVNDHCAQLRDLSEVLGEIRKPAFNPQ